MIDLTIAASAGAGKSCTKLRSIFSVSIGKRLT
jgi:hypothetical protein